MTLVIGSTPAGTPLLEDTTTGTTTDDYADNTLTIETGGFPRKIISLKNTGGSNTLKYKIDTSIDNVVYFGSVAETTLAPAATASKIDTDDWKYVKVQVKNNATTAATTYSLVLRGSVY